MSERFEAAHKAERELAVIFEEHGFSVDLNEQGDADTYQERMRLKTGDDGVDLEVGMHGRPKTKLGLKTRPGGIGLRWSDSKLKARFPTLYVEALDTFHDEDKDQWEYMIVWDPVAEVFAVCSYAAAMEHGTPEWTRFKTGHKYEVQTLRLDHWGTMELLLKRLRGQ